MDVEAAFPAHGEPAELVHQGEGLLDDVAQFAQASTPLVFGLGMIGSVPLFVAAPIGTPGRYLRDTPAAGGLEWPRAEKVRRKCAPKVPFRPDDEPTLRVPNGIGCLLCSESAIGCRSRGCPEMPARRTVVPFRADHVAHHPAEMNWLFRRWWFLRLRGPSRGAPS